MTRNLTPEEVCELLPAVSSASMALEREQLLKKYITQLGLMPPSPDYIKNHFAKELEILEKYQADFLFVQELREKLLNITY